MRASSRLDRARPEVQELSLLLVDLASSTPSPTASSVQKRPEREQMQAHDAKSVDSWSSPAQDPWTPPIHLGKDEKYQLQGKGICVPLPRLVEKIIALPNVQLLKR